MVALDVHALQVEGWADRGVGRYVANYASALARRGALAGALLAPELPPPSGLPNDLVAAGLIRWDTAASCRELVASSPSPLAYHVTAPFLHCEPGGPAALEVVEHWARSGVGRVVLLHDLIPLRAPRHYLAAPGSEARYRSRAEWVAGADLIVTNSEHTRREAVELLGCHPGRVVTVGVGVSPFFSPPDGTDEELWRFNFPSLVGRPHILTVGGSDVRKGTDRAIAALGLLVGRGFDLSLLVLGHLTDEWRRSLRLAADACGVGDRVVLGGGVDDELLRACYRRAVLTVMPSLAEGAGLPVLESAACGTPALASATSALAETAGTPAAWFDPTDAGSMADAVAAAVDSAGRRAAILAVQSRLAAVSTWDAVAERAVAALVGAGLEAGGGGSAGGFAGGFVGGSAGGSAGGFAPRLALVGWPAGEETRLERVAAAWGGPVDVVSVGAPSPAAGPGTVHRVVAAASLGTDVRAASYEGLVHVLTGGPEDEAVLGLAGRYPGWLWIWGVPSPAVGRALEPLVRRSCGLLVGSEAARHAVRLELRPLAAEPPVVVLPAGGEAAGLVAAVRGAAIGLG